VSCPTILLLLLAAGALWLGAGHCCLVSTETFVQEAGQILADYCSKMCWDGSAMAKWISLPRLVTRTKESNMCASIGVANPHAQ